MPELTFLGGFQGGIEAAQRRRQMQFVQQAHADDMMMRQQQMQMDQQRQQFAQQEMTQRMDRIKRQQGLEDFADFAASKFDADEHPGSWAIEAPKFGLSDPNDIALGIVKGSMLSRARKEATARQESQMGLEAARAKNLNFDPSTYMTGGPPAPQSIGDIQGPPAPGEPQTPTGAVSGITPAQQQSLRNIALATGKMPTAGAAAKILNPTAPRDAAKLEAGKAASDAWLASIKGKNVDPMIAQDIASKYAKGQTVPWHELNVALRGDATSARQSAVEIAKVLHSTLGKVYDKAAAAAAFDPTKQAEADEAKKAYVSSMDDISAAYKMPTSAGPKNEESVDPQDDYNAAAEALPENATNEEIRAKAREIAKLRGAK